LKHRLLIAIAVVFLFALMVPAVASAFSWTIVGGDPLVPGGVWSKQGYVDAMKKALVRQRFQQVRAGNHQPDWVLTKAFQLAKSTANVHQGTIAYGEYVGTMGSGHAVDYSVWYFGQYNPLGTFYVQPKKTTTVKINGLYYRQTVSYQVTLAKPCGNALIIHKKVVKKRLYELRVEKHLNSKTGKLLAGWQIVSQVGGKVKNLTTKSTGSVLIGRYLAGTGYNVLEINQEDWVIVSPTEGVFKNKMPRRNLTLKFVNKRVTEELVKLYVEKRQDTFDGPFLADWTIEGTVGDQPILIPTSADGPVLVDEYPVGTGFNLHEIQQDGWELVSPEGGRFEGVLESDTTLTWVNTQTPPCYVAFATKGYWHNRNGLAEMSVEDLAYINSLPPYSDNPFDGLDEAGNPVPEARGVMGEVLAPEGSWRAEVSNYLVAPNSGGDPTIQLGQQLLAFIFNVQHRLGGLDVLMQLPDGTWLTGGDIIDAASVAWVVGGDDANYWVSVLDSCNNSDSIPCQP
jgi:hypothetical protein